MVNDEIATQRTANTALKRGAAGEPFAQDEAMAGRLSNAALALMNSRRSCNTDQLHRGLGRDPTFMRYERDHNYAGMIDPSPSPKSGSTRRSLPQHPRRRPPPLRCRTVGANR
jgi:hypothetical protein